jgi:hypothetical protein
MKDDPPVVGSAAALTKWLWRIHNKVNEKLRSQGLPTEDDPPFDDVKEIYEERLTAGCSRVSFEGWEFLFSIAENHPMSRSGKNSEPLPNAPAVIPRTAAERNRWNVLSPKERMNFYKDFWRLLPRVLPFEEWRTRWTSIASETRLSTISSLYHLRCKMEKELNLLNKTDYSSLCAELRTHRSGCNKKKRGKTCRKNRGTK